jgi:mitochondrial fission protein ELM1
VQQQRPASVNNAIAHSSTVWSLSDAKAGNRRQAVALAHAMGQPFRDWTLQPQAPWQWLAPRRWPGAGRAFGEDFARAAPPRLAIGCGRQAALATRLLRERGARAVQILDPRIATDHWDLVIAPEHDRLRGDNVISLLGSLHPVDDLWLAAARRDFESFSALPGPRTALLLGGASAHARFDDALYESVLVQVEAIVRGEGGSLMATASRRTPASVRQHLRERLSTLPGVVWRGEEDGANPYAGLLGWADRIVCTADSVNMISEAAATWAPVFVAGVERVDGRPRRFLASVLERGRVRPLDQAPDPYPVTPLRETARVAAQVQARLRW